jgi:exonuclease VII small subunit
MKKLLAIFFITTIGLLISAFKDNGSSGQIEYFNSIGEIEIPENVKGILDNSCWGCHNSESNNTKAKLKLKFDKLNDLKVSKQVSKLNKIVKALEKGDMPPEKTINKYPDMALTPETKTELIDWAKATSDELTK